MNDRLGRLESAIIGIFAGIACPLLTFVAFWWTAAMVHMYVFSIPVGVIIAAALSGLVVGCLLDVAFLRRWIDGFYSANVWVMTVVYLALCVVAVAFFMGLPVGTFSLGIVACAYIGRREHHRQVDGERVASALRKSALLAASTTAAAALPIGIFALNEPDVLRLLEGHFGLAGTSLHGSVGLMLIGLLCFLLFAMQYWCSRAAGYVAFRIGGSNAQ